MSQDFVTELRLQLREAALREERRAPVRRRVAHARRRLPGPAPVAAALAVALLALAVAVGVVALRGDKQPAEPKVVGTYPVASSLSRLATASGAVWTADPIRGEILRIDPATRRVAARIPVGAEASVGAGAGAVWALAGDLQYGGDKGPVRLLRIDPATNRVVARLPVRAPGGDSLGLVELQIGRGVVWVVGVAGALRIDPSRNVADRFVSFAGRAGEAARGAVTDRDSVWVLAVDGRLRELDARTGDPVRELRLAAPADSHLFPGRPGTLTLTGADRITVLERASGRLLWSNTLAGEIRYWFGEDDTLWVQASDEPALRNRLVRLDAGSGRRLGQVDLPEPGVAGIARVGRDIWVAGPGGKIVVVRP
jgi:PQQ-like domain